VRCLNKVFMSGEVVDLIHYGETPNGTGACTFYVVSSRPQFGPPTKTKVNVYGGKLVDICKHRLRLGNHIMIEGELMNRNAAHDLVTVEVRAHELFFYDQASRGRD
jgi:single-stranded DNA-binding protein